MFQLRVFTRNHQFQAIQGDICVTIFNFGDESMKGTCVKWNTFLARWTSPWKFLKVFGKWKAPVVVETSDQMLEDLSF